MLVRQIARNFSTSVARMSGHGPDGVPGGNLPFSIRNRYTLFAGFVILLNSAFIPPYILLRYQMLKY